MANAKNKNDKNIKGKKEIEKAVNAPNPFDALKNEVKRGIASIFVFCLALVFGLSAFSAAGVGGSFIFKVFYKLFGIGFYIIPICFLVFAVYLLKSRREEKPHYGFTVTGLIMTVLGLLGMVDLMKPMLGGYCGKFFGAVEKLFGVYAGFAILFSLFISGIIISTEAQLNLNLFKMFLRLFRKEKKEQIVVKTGEDHNETKIDLKKEALNGKEEEKKPVERAEVNILNGNIDKSKEVELLNKRKIQNYQLPPLDLLDNQVGKPTVGDVRACANIIKRTLENFGVFVEMCDVCIGPTVTQYTLKPADGTKLTKITGLHNDLALALAAHPIRIEAPIPGKSLVGIEVPNKVVAMVRLRSLLSTEEFQKSEDCLLFPVGRNVANEPIFGNLAKMPHLLVAGATGTGKSVGLHSLVMSLLYRNSPDQLKFIMIDPKRVELSHYEGIPHLITPVITDNKKALPALR